MAHFDLRGLFFDFGAGHLVRRQDWDHFLYSVAGLQGEFLIDTGARYSWISPSVARDTATGGTVHHGPQSAAGATAHLPLDGRPERCLCGRRGCLQAAVSSHELGVRAAREGPEEGYEPAQVRRLWTIVSFQRELGVNLAGVEVILGLFDRLAEVHRRVGGLAEELREALEDEASGPVGGDEAR